MAKNNSDTTWLALGLGLIAGGMAGYYLATDEGREMRRKVGSNLKDAADTAKHQIQYQSAELSNRVQNAAEKAQVYVKDVAATTKQYTEEVSAKAKNTLSRTVENAEEQIEEGSDSFKKGVEKAKRRINSKLAEAENLSINSNS